MSNSNFVHYALEHVAMDYSDLYDAMNLAASIEDLVRVIPLVKNNNLSHAEESLINRLLVISSGIEALDGSGVEGIITNIKKKTEAFFKKLAAHFKKYWGFYLLAVTAASGFFILSDKMKKSRKETRTIITNAKPTITVTNTNPAASLTKEESRARAEHFVEGLMKIENEKNDVCDSMLAQARAFYKKITELEPDYLILRNKMSPATLSSSLTNNLSMIFHHNKTHAEKKITSFEEVEQYSHTEVMAWVKHLEAVKKDMEFLRAAQVRFSGEKFDAQALTSIAGEIRIRSRITEAIRSYISGLRSCVDAAYKILDKLRKSAERYGKLHISLVDESAFRTYRLTDMYFAALK